MITFRRIAWAGFAALVVSAALCNSPAQAANKAKQAQSREALSSLIDQQIQEILNEEKMPASQQASDAEFLRRVYLDIVGVIPTAEEAKKFLDSSDPSKRAQLIDQLLADPRYGKHFADIWAAKMITETTDNRRLNKAPLEQWLVEQFNANTPWNEFVYNLITAEGTQDKNGAVTYFLGSTTIDRLTDNVTRQFLGVQLQCAQCHDHPFVDWKQEEYWGMAMFFQNVSMDNPNRAAKDKSFPGVSEMVAQKPVKGKRQKNTKRGFRLPISAKKVSPKFLQGEEPNLDSVKAWRPILAKWMTSPENPFFAKAIVNRTWAHFFGRGLVNPVDDINKENQATHPELMQKLTEGFVANNFDVKELVRVICNSEAYQRTSKPMKENLDAEPVIYARMGVKVLRPGQLYDSLQQVMAQGKTSRELTPAEKRKLQQQKQRNRGASQRDQFIEFFKRGDGVASDEYTAGIPQALRMINSREFGSFGLVTKLVRESKEPKEILENLYLSTLSRRPTEQESKFLLEKVSSPKDTAAYNDILWALLNCSEFALNH